jgi:hypothetical protein
VLQGTHTQYSMNLNKGEYNPDTDANVVEGPFILRDNVLGK